MDGREPVGISYTPSYVRDQRDLAEFNRWYKEVHFVDVVKAKVLMNPIMFHNTLRPLPPHGDSLIIMYELYYQDLEAGTAAFQPFQPKLRNDYDQTKGVRSPNRGQYRVLQRSFGPKANKRSETMYVERINGTDPEKLESLRTWYIQERLPSLMASGLFHTGSFGEATRNGVRSPESPTATRFLGLFESSGSDANGNAAAAAPRGTQPSYVEFFERVAARRDS